MKKLRTATIGLLGAGLVLSLATVLLVLYLVGLVLVASLAVGLATDLGLVSADGSLDVAGLAVRAAGAAVVAWAAGLAVARWLARGSALPLWAAGVVSGLLGCAAGSVVLHLVGLL